MTTRRDQRDAKRLRSRRIRAILAGGLVFGVGATATLAAWNDSEFGTTTFTAGRFNIEGSTDGTTWAQHPTSPGASMTFRLGAAVAGALTPGDTVYALFSVRTPSTPTAPSMGGTVQLNAASTNNTGLGAYLTYRVKTISGTTCDATAFNGGSDITGLTGTNVSLNTSAGAPQNLAAGGAQINYCFAVTLPSGTSTTAQGATLNAVWEFAATSTS